MWNIIVHFKELSHGILSNSGGGGDKTTFELEETRK